MSCPSRLLIHQIDHSASDDEPAADEAHERHDLERRRRAAVARGPTCGNASKAFFG